MRFADCHPDRKHRAKGLCNACHCRIWQQENKDKVKARNNRSYYKIKRELLAAYGGKCACCGETEPVFLSLEHKNGGGVAHRKRLGGGHAIWWELKRLNWPQEEYTILCHNCQRGTMRPEGCPHKRV